MKRKRTVEESVDRGGTVPLPPVVPFPRITPTHKASKCVVCAEEVATGAGPNALKEDLCWVCRRLKFSAWRDSDGQLPAQE